MLIISFVQLVMAGLGNRIRLVCKKQVFTTNLKGFKILWMGEYILYRDNIIKALLKAIGGEEYDEKHVHDIFMTMKIDSFGAGVEKPVAVG